MAVRVAAFFEQSAWRRGNRNRKRSITIGRTDQSSGQIQKAASDEALEHEAGVLTAEAEAVL